MASGEAEPLQYTTTVLRVSIHCEGCKKKVRKVLHNIEGVYKVTVDAAQHKVTVTGSVGADALIRRLHKSGKQAVLWPVPAATVAKKPEGVAAGGAPSAGESGKGADKADAKAKPKGAAKEAESESSEKKPEKDKSSDKKPEKAEAKKPKDEAKKESDVAEKEKGSPEPAKEAAAEEAGGEVTSGKKGKKKKNKQKDAGEGDAAAEKPPQPQPQLQPAMPVPAPALGPARPHGGFPFYPPQPVMSYNVAHPSSSVSYYAPTPVLSMQPMLPPPPQMPYGYSPYPPMLPPPEFLYGPPGMRSSPPQEAYNNMFYEESPNSCSLM